MKTRLRISKDSNLLYEGVHEIVDATSFANACGQAWNALTERSFKKATSIGALYDTLEGKGDELDGVVIALESAER